MTTPIRQSIYGNHPSVCSPEDRAQIRAQRAASLYNLHTSPTALRSDSEHARHRKAARRVLAIIRQHSLPVTELDNGKLYVSANGEQRLYS